jgi:hypothetical protein
MLVVALKLIKKVSDVAVSNNERAETHRMNAARGRESSQYFGTPVKKGFRGSFPSMFSSCFRLAYNMLASCRRQVLLWEENQKHSDILLNMHYKTHFSLPAAPSRQYNIFCKNIVLLALANT